MPRYFIDTDDGSFRHRDEDGHDLPNIEAARQAAVAALPAIAQDTPPSCDRHAYSVRVRDEAGTVLYTAELSFAGEWHARP